MLLLKGYLKLKCHANCNVIFENEIHSSPDGIRAYAKFQESAFVYCASFFPFNRI